MHKYLKSMKLGLCLWFFVLLIGCNGFGSGGDVSGGGSDTSQNVLLLSDIHFNPYEECSLSVLPCPSLRNLIENPSEQWSNYLNTTIINNYSEETNNAFLTLGFDNLALIAANKNVKTVLITGDLLTHNFDRNYRTFAPAEYGERLTEFSTKTLLYVLQELRKRLPVSSKIYLVLGNNDNDSGNYAMQSEAFLNSVGTYLSGFIDNNNDKANFISSFGKGGYFSLPLSSHISLIGLNTNPISSTLPNESAAMEQLKWLNNELVNAKNNSKKVIIIQHIPYGLDWYYSADEDAVYPVLDSNLQAMYLQLLEQYASIITTIYAGHYHREFFSLIENKIPLLGTIAFNSYFGNNPGFKIANITSDGVFNGYTTYYSTLGTGSTLAWAPLYEYSIIYGNPAQITATLSNFPYGISAAQTAYRQYYDGGDTPSREYINDDAKWKYYYCGIKFVESPAYTECLKQY